MKDEKKKVNFDLLLSPPRWRGIYKKELCLLGRPLGVSEIVVTIMSKRQKERKTKVELFGIRIIKKMNPFGGSTLLPCGERKTGRKRGPRFSTIKTFS